MNKIPADTSHRFQYFLPNLPQLQILDCFWNIYNLHCLICFKHHAEEICSVLQPAKPIQSLSVISKRNIRFIKCGIVFCLQCNIKLILCIRRQVFTVCKLLLSVLFPAYNNSFKRCRLPLCRCTESGLFCHCANLGCRFPRSLVSASVIVKALSLSSGSTLSLAPDGSPAVTAISVS